MGHETTCNPGGMVDTSLDSAALHSGCIYKNREMTDQFRFKNTIPGNLPELKEILIHANEEFQSGKLDQLQFTRISSVSSKIVDYINWIIEDRGL